MSIDKTLKNRLSLNRPSNIRKSNKTPVSKIVTESRKNPPPKPSESEIFKRELEEIAKRAEMMRILEEEDKLIQKKRDDEKLQEKLVAPFTGKKQVDMKPSLEYAIEELLPKAQIPEQIEYPEPFQEEPALNRELAEFKKKINQHLHQVGFMGSGGGGIGDIKDAGDVDAGTALVDGKFLKFDSSTQKFVGADASSSGATAADDISAGDAAINLTTTSGNITIDAAANNSDIIFKGTDGGSDTTFLTIDGSAAGAATFNDKIVATELDISGDVDVDGTLEADAITVNGTTLTETVQDIVGAMVSSNTESGITVAYQDADGTLDFTVGTLNQDTTGSAATLTTARTIGGVSFDGSANINLPGVNTSGNQDTSGTAAKVTVTDSNANTNFPVVFHDESNALLDDTGQLRYNPSTGELLVPKLTVAGTTTQVDTVTMEAQNAIIFEGATADGNETTLTITDPTADRTITLPNATGTVALTSSDITGNAATATALETARNIGGVSFDGTGNINLPGVNTSGSQDTSGNAATATALATARNIAGVSFDGTANISLALTNLGISDGSNGQFLKTDGSGNFSFATASVSSLAADDIDAGDAAVNITTSSGNITIDAAANNTDIIFKGTDASSDITMLTLDGSDAGTAIFNNDIKLQSDDAVIAFGADGDVTLTHDPDDGLFLKSSATADNNPVQITLQTGETDIQADDAIGAIKFQAPDEATGSDANLVVASFGARSEGDFSATANATFFEFRLSTDGGNVRVAKLSNNGNLQVNGTLTADATSTLLIKNSSGSTLKTVNGFAANS